MVESLRSVTVTVEVDTNKGTYRETFDSIEEAREWLEYRLEALE